MKNENENEKKTEKKGFFARLNIGPKIDKSSCCCNFEVEEIPDEKVDNKGEKKPPENKTIS